MKRGYASPRSAPPLNANILHRLTVTMLNQIPALMRNRNESELGMTERTEM
jgi:hypothetical protein